MSINNTRSENLIDLLFEYSPDLILIHDLKGSITNMNENLIKILGYKSKEDILKLQIKDILNYENKDFILSKFLKLILNKSKHIEYYFKTKKNAHIPVEGFGFPYKMGKLDIIVNISTIIHDKKKLQKKLLNTKKQLDNLMVKIPEIRLWALSDEKKINEILQKGGIVLKESEKKYREILESIKEGYFEVDLEGNLVFFNDSLCDILGYSPEELVGKHFRNFMELENEKLEEFFNIDEIDGKAYEFELIKKNREKIYVESSLSKKQNTEGIVIGFYGLVRDVTKRKEAEKKLKDSEQNLINLNKELEQRIELRTKKLKESEELYHKAYDQVNFYKDLLTHDISNILQTIKSAGELSFIYINDPKKLNELYEIWNLVNSQVNRGNRLVSNVRRLSQIEYTQIPIQPIEVFSFLQEAIKFTQKGIQGRKTNFQIDSPFKTYNINANELLLDVFENILINATTYNNNPIIEILIKISKLQKDRIEFLKLEFIDNGIGISDDRKKLIFEKGYKKEKQSKGMGLGLSLVKKIIKSYRGQIWVEDKVIGDYTKGSNFIIIIPEK